MLGSLMIFSTTSAEVLDHALKKSTHLAFLKQLIYALGGIVAGIVVWKGGYHRILRWSPALLGLFTFFSLSFDPRNWKRSEWFKKMARHCRFFFSTF